MNLLRTHRASGLEAGGLLLPPLRSHRPVTMPTIQLFLWRHAEAEDGFDDLARPLTAKGRRDATRVARALAKQLDGHTRVLVSPATRTRETVARLIDRTSLSFEVDPRLAPGARLDEILDALEGAITTGTDESPTVVMVGHQPWIGQLARRLLTNGHGDWSVKKASAWWLVRRSRDGSTEWTMRSVLDPELV